MNQYNQQPYYISPQPTQSTNLKFAYDQQIKQTKRKEKVELLTAGLAIGATTLVYLFNQSIGLSLLKLFGMMDMYSKSSSIQSLANVLIVHAFSMLLPFGLLALIFRKRFNTQVIPRKKVGVVPFWAWVFLGLGTCFWANMTTGMIANVFEKSGHGMNVPEIAGPASVLDCVALIVSTAIVPAVIEELSLRCFFTGILRKHGKGLAVFLCSFTFAMLHANIVQIIFAFEVGLILGYITERTDSVIPAMMIHGFNNGLSVAQSIIEYGAGKTVASNVVVIVYMIWLATSIAGLIYLAVTKRLLPKKNKEPKPATHINVFAKLLYFLPGMIIPMIIFGFLTIITTFPELTNSIIK